MRATVLALAAAALTGGAVLPLQTLEPAVANAAGSTTQTGQTDTSGAACPASNPPNELLLAAGTPQTAQLDTAFSSALQVTLENTNGCPVSAVAGTPVTFTAPAGEASATFAASGSSVVTVGADSSGNASAGALTANDTPGSYTITATSAYGSVRFSLTNTAAGIPATVTAVSPARQQAIAGSPYEDPLSVRVLDANGQPISGVTVTFTLGAGGSSAAAGGTGGSSGSSGGAGAAFAGAGSTATAQTGTDGVASSPPFTANQTAGSFLAFATASGVSRPAGFQLLNLPASGERLTRIGSARRTATVGRPYRGRLRVRMRDAGGNPVIGATVTFTLGTALSGGGSAGVAAGGSGAGGSFTDGTDSATATTGKGGVAVSPAITANPVVGSFTAVATSTTTGNVGRFTLINLPGRGERLRRIGSARRTTTVGQPFRGRLRVRMRDAGGSPVIGAPVTFTLGTLSSAGSSPGGGATGGSGASASFTNGINTVTVTTGGSGIAVSPPFSANTVIGSFNAVATSTTTSSVASFTLTNRPGRGERLAIIGSTRRSATVAQRFASRLAVRLLDPHGRPLIGATIAFTLGNATSTGSGRSTSGSGSAGAAFPGAGSQATEVTDANGIAVSPRFTANTKAGSYTATATTTTGNSTATFQLDNRPGPAASITAGAAATEATTVETPFLIPLAVTITDTYGNPVHDAPVTFTAPTAGASGSFDGRGKVTVRTDQHGSAVAPPLTADDAPGGYIVTATTGHAHAAAFALVNQAQ